MAGESQYGTGSVNFYAGILWTWTIIVVLATGIWAALIFGTIDPDSGQAELNGAAFLGGLVGGAFSTLPLWALFGLGAYVARKHRAARAEQRQHARDIGAAIESLQLELATITASIASPLEESEASEAGDVDTLSAVAPHTAEVLARLLDGPVIGNQARKARQTYGRAVAAAFLARKAHDVGYTDAVITEADLPATL